MFSRTFFVALLAVAAAGVTGSPVELEEGDPLGNVFYCDCEGWTGSCATRPVEVDTCKEVHNEEYNIEINAFGPDDGIYCVLYGWILVSLVYFGQDSLTLSRCVCVVGDSTAQETTTLSIILELKTFRTSGGTTVWSRSDVNHIESP